MQLKTYEMPFFFLGIFLVPRTVLWVPCLHRCKEHDICGCPLTSIPQIGAKRKAVKGKQPKITPTTVKDTPLSLACWRKLKLSLRLLKITKIGHVLLFDSLYSKRSLNGHLYKSDTWCWFVLFVLLVISLQLNYL